MYFRTAGAFGALLLAASASEARAQSVDLEAINDALAADGASMRVLKFEALGALGQGLTVYAKDVGNTSLPERFVYADPRLGGYGGLFWAIDDTEGATASGLTAADTAAAIDRAMATWDAQTCSDLGLNGQGGTGVDAGFIEAYIDQLYVEAGYPPPGFGGSYGVYGQVTHAGWQPGLFFDIIAPGGSQYILGVTFTLVWTDDEGNFTDIDGDGHIDAAFREIYYNDAFWWAIDGHIDVESVALHEAGHGLSQGHFGTLFTTPGRGDPRFFRAAPGAVMNAAYIGIQHDLAGTDLAQHCSIWAGW